jgi:hypothetical protein
VYKIYEFDVRCAGTLGAVKITVFFSTINGMSFEGFDTVFLSERGQE